MEIYQIRFKRQLGLLGIDVQLIDVFGDTGWGREYFASLRRRPECIVRPVERTEVLSTHDIKIGKLHVHKSICKSDGRH